LASFACWGTVALAQTSQDATPPRPTHRLDQTEVTDLAKDNFSRVAASAEEIRQILAKDSGLLVELKKLVAKEATDYGQVIQDSDLTDQAVFDRLGRDVLFRSAATRLLQRYGYLLPSVNPYSDLGKQQEFVLKERARKLVQIEAEEDSRAQQPARQMQQTQFAAACDPVRDTDCDQGSLKTRARNGLNLDNPTGEPGPQTVKPGSDGPVEPQTEKSSQLLRAASQNQADHFSDSLGGDISELMPVSTGAASTQTMTALAGNVAPQSSTGLPTGSMPVLSDRRESSAENFTTASGRTSESKFGRRNRKGIEPEPPSTVHRPNPYSDIPSLFDMYVQAAPAQKSPERFGLEVFRNSAADLNVIPMDLPVGPDYVVGPGDGLAIDLWGGVSQRFSRLVDREGRVSLPEVGPVLVAGKSLGYLQQSLQQVFRSEFRDVSADVSLSRLRTVRVYVVGDVQEPGAYDISSLSTPLNALFAAGGVKAQGSLRHLKHYRGNELVEEVDAYDLLLHGVRGEVKRLENGDTLMVPPIGRQITIDGMVRRPAIYELRDETSLADALELAGAFCRPRRCGTLR
jgi:protein involved in polysaccharide export with SLBB domain